MNEIDFIIIFLALALGIPLGYGLTYLIAWLIVEHQENVKKMRRRPDYYRHRRNWKIYIMIFIGVNIVLIIPMLISYWEEFYGALP